MPLSVVAEPTGLSRSRLGLPENAFLFAFAFDFVSTFERKNPIAVVEAFKKAFGDQSHVHLFIKSINGWMFKNEMKRLSDVIGGSANVTFVDRVWERTEMNGLIENCDCYLTLHRSEGFGFTMAEAMSYGKPVIATDYSANTEFMDANNSLPVRYRLVELERDIGPYKAGSQ
jgi:glycosyltransferase involved in cell wall biosynthesis